MNQWKETLATRVHIEWIIVHSEITKDFYFYGIILRMKNNGALCVNDYRISHSWYVKAVYIVKQFYGRISSYTANFGAKMNVILYDSQQTGKQ